jgi:subfamily B ATP-binding cassette protein MsbA
MDKGLIVEQGSHLELVVKENGIYKKLYDSQFMLETDFSN